MFLSKNSSISGSASWAVARRLTCHGSQSIASSIVSARSLGAAEGFRWSNVWGNSSDMFEAG
ncbi:MAG: hypothetical protein B7Z52_06955, partial [Burkholderiales bacterium 12-64-5]